MAASTPRPDLRRFAVVGALLRKMTLEWHYGDISYKITTIMMTKWNENYYDDDGNVDLIVGAGEGERGRSRLGSAEGSAAELSKMSKYTELWCGMKENTNTEHFLWCTLKENTDNDWIYNYDSVLFTWQEEQAAELRLRHPVRKWK